MDGMMKKDNELIALREANEAKDKALKKAESKYNRLKGWYRNRYTLMKSSLIEEFNERESHHLAMIERLEKKVAIRDEMVKKLEQYNLAIDEKHTNTVERMTIEWSNVIRPLKTDVLRLDEKIKAKNKQIEELEIELKNKAAEISQLNRVVLRKQNYIDRVKEMDVLQKEKIKELNEKIKELEKHSEIVFENYQKANRDSDKYKKSFLDLNSQHQTERTVFVILICSLIGYMFFF
jgi:chromosome segregation ATPase